MNHDAIYALYPNVFTVSDEFGAFDAQGNKVEIDEVTVAAWVDPKEYQRQRANAYPSLQEQLDMQYWDSINGTTIWQDTINAVKAQYPKV